MVIEENFTGAILNGLTSFPGRIMDMGSSSGSDFLENRTSEFFPFMTFHDHIDSSAALKTTALPMFSFPDSSGGGGSSNSNDIFSRTSVLGISAATTTIASATTQFIMDNAITDNQLNSSFISSYGSAGDDMDPSSLLYSNPTTIFAILVTFSVCTIFGNTLVMLAVAREHYLKSPPNYFVASLAAADFSVGVLLVPFEAITQLLNRRWIFGNTWCELWHSFDVLLSTASILNLCVISLDRYWAICTPMSYPRRMTSKRAFKFIALIWICAIVISLPAIFWWRSVRTGEIKPETCPFTEDVGYLVSSSCISFYIPLSVMLFAYFKIYKAAIKQSKSIQAGAKLFASNDKNGTRDLTLRMHRGGCCNGSGTPGIPGSILLNSNAVDEKPALNYHRKSISFGRSDPTGLALLHNNCKRTASVKVSRKVGYPLIRKNSGRRNTSESSGFHEQTENTSGGGVDGLIAPPSPTATILLSPMSAATQEDDESRREEVTAVSGDGLDVACTHLISQDGVDPNLLSPFDSSPRSSSSAPINNNYNHNTHSPHHNGYVKSHTFSPGATFRRQSRRSFTVARKIAKFAKEKKAAKTLAIVLGVFIICWLPFFVINIVFAICKSCGEGHLKLFEVVTWLGWINSAMNPVIYACWSPDLRK